MARVLGLLGGAACATLLMLPATGSAQLDRAFVEPCRRTESFPLPATRGPFDYRNQRQALQMVESNHFTPPVESLLRGKTGPLAQDLSFVLHAFPNHHRALVSVMRYAEREKQPQPGGLDYTVDCYLQRALVFRPDDNVARMLYADWLSRTQRPQEAKQQLDYVRSIAGDNPLTHYNLGLLYFQIGRYDEALTQAHRAIAMGVPMTELRDRLSAKGQWKDAPAEGAAAAAPAASAASN